MEVGIRIEDEAGRTKVDKVSLAEGITTADTEFTDLVAAIDAISNGSVKSWSVESEVAYGGAVEADVNAPYSAKDKLLLSFQTGDADNCRYELPCPKNALIAPHDEKVDTGNALFTALRDAILAAACNEDDEAVETFVAGKRMRRKRGGD